MFWTLIEYLICLAIGVPILGIIYYKFTNTTNGTFTNSTAINSTALGVTPLELSYFTILPILVAIMIIIFIAALLGGKFEIFRGGE